MIAAAKAAGLAVTAEAAPHHFTLTDAECAGYDATYKVHPPLRTAADVAAVAAGIADGTLDAIATDHAPHPPEDKERPFDQAPPGMLGLEYALALAFTELVDAGPTMSEADVIARMSWAPAAIAGMAEHGRTVRGRRSGEPVRRRPGGSLDDRCDRRGITQSERALRGPRGAGPGSPHGARRRSRRDRRRGTAVTLERAMGLRRAITPERWDPR